MTWRVQCNLYGSDTPVWFVVRNLYADREQYVLNGHGRPMPFRSEEDAYRVCDNLNANDVTELSVGDTCGRAAFA